MGNSKVSGRVGTKAFALLVLTLGLVAIAVAAIVAQSLYRVAVDDHQRWLTDVLESRAQLIIAVAAHDQAVAQTPEDAFATTVSQIRKAEHAFAGFGETGEFTLALRQGESIEFVTQVRHEAEFATSTVAWESPLAEPMRRALRGETGTIRGSDYRGVEVLAAYRPITTMGLGLVVKIDVAELRAPFLRTAASVAMPCVGILLVGAFLFLRLGRPMAQRLAASEEQLRVLFDSARDAIVIVGADGSVVSANRAADVMFGYERGGLSKRDVCQLLPERLREPTRIQVAEALEAGGGSRGTVLEVVALRKDGTEVPVEMAVATFTVAGERFMSGIVRDITARQRWEGDLERLAVAVDQVGDAVMITDAAGVVLYVNSTYENITGFPTPEVIGKHLSDIRGFYVGDEQTHPMADTIGRAEAWSGRLQCRRKDGTTFHSDSSISPVLDGESHEIINYVAIVRDVSQEVLLEEEGRQAQKMEAVGQLAGGIAHDFNNLLTGISGFVQLTLSAQELEDQAESDLNSVLRLVQNARDLTQRLLVFSSRAPSTRGRLDLDALVCGSAQMLDRMIGKNIRIDVESDIGDQAIWGDHGQIEQVLVNLVINARDAMPDGGNIRIRTTARRIMGGDAEALRLVPGSYGVLSVKDDGVGMDEPTQRRVFEPFFTTKESGKGTGLGLAMAYGIATEHDGAIHVRSQSGHGATFTMYLPLANGSKTGRAPADNDPAGAPGAGELILLVDDETSVREVLERMLTGYGYEVIVAACAEEAERLYESRAQDIALLLADIVMPEKSGLALYETLAEKNPALPVVFMSGHTEESEKLHELVAAGATFLAKPPDFDALARKVRAALDR